MNVESEDLYKELKSHRLIVVFYHWVFLLLECQTTSTSTTQHSQDEIIKSSQQLQTFNQQTVNDMTRKQQHRNRRRKVSLESIISFLPLQTPLPAESSMAAAAAAAGKVWQWQRRRRPQRLWVTTGAAGADSNSTVKAAAAAAKWSVFQFESLIRRQSAFLAITTAVVKRTTNWCPSCDNSWRSRIIPWIYAC